MKNHETTHAHPGNEAVDHVARWSKLGAFAARIIRKNQYSYDEPQNADSQPTHGAFEIIPAAEIATRMSIDRFVKLPPQLSEQLTEEDRLNIITFEPLSPGFSPGSDWRKSRRRKMSEIDSLRALDEFLQSAASTLPDYKSELARLLLDNLTFIGGKEFREGTAGIAAYWKAELERNHRLQIFAAVGESTKPDYRTFTDKTAIKSDEYVLENILSNFSDKEIEAYGGRLVVDANDIMMTDPKDTKVVLVDDWTIGGETIDSAYNRIKKKFPHLADSTEVHLLAASDERIDNGFAVAGEDRRLPVRAYYRARALEFPGDACISGSHSSADVGYQDWIGGLVYDMHRQRKQISRRVYTPPTTRIIRPYRQEGVTRSDYLVHTRRLRELVGRR